MDWTETKVVLPAFLILVAWAALLSSDVLVGTIPYALVSGTFDLLRTVATVVGGTVAVLAYRKWRRPDDARLRSQMAQEIIRQLRQTEVGVQEARVQGTTVYLSGEEPSIEDKMEEAR